MGILTISTPGDLENLLLPQDKSCYCLDRINIIIINMSGECLAKLGLNDDKVVHKIRAQEHLSSVPLIFAKDSVDNFILGEEYADFLG